MELLIQTQLPLFIKEKFGYCRTPFLNNVCDTAFDLEDYYLQVDCKGISVSYNTTKVSNNELVELIKQFNPNYVKPPSKIEQAKNFANANNIDITGLKKFKEIEPKISGYVILTPTQYNTKYLRDNYKDKLDGNYEFIDEIYWKKDNELTEINPMGSKFQDHAPGDFHMKTSQSCLTYDGEGYKSTIEKNTVLYKGLLPQNTDKPQHTFIIKHVYTENHNKNPSILRIELYSIPHCITEKFYNLQQKNNVDRPAKAKEEFRFNMNDENDVPYKFLNSDEPRYKVFNLTD